MNDNIEDESMTFDNFSDLYELMNREIKKDKNKTKEFGEAANISEELKSISFLNKYFIYKKVRNIDINDIANILERNNSDDDKIVEENREAIKETQKETIKIKVSKKTGKSIKLKPVKSDQVK